MPFYRTAAPPSNPVVVTNPLFNTSVMELVGSTFTNVVMDPTKVVYFMYCPYMVVKSYKSSD